MSDEQRSESVGVQYTFLVRITVPAPIPGDTLADFIQEALKHQEKLNPRLGNRIKAVEVQTYIPPKEKP